MRITKNAVTRTCAICERTLLMGERVHRFAPHPGAELVDVCPLCHDAAYEHGWLKEGAPSTPSAPPDRRRRPRLARLFDPRRDQPAASLATEPILRRLSQPELAMVEAADLFNASQYRRTVDGIAKSLGSPRASIVALSGTTGELVVTVAWDLSWYQYRVSPESGQPVRPVERGHELDDLEDGYKRWNARVDDDGRLVPDIARV
jgi:hypothetical protein